MNIADVTIHIDETLNKEEVESLSSRLHEVEGIISVGLHEDKPHLMIIGYEPSAIQAKAILNAVTEDGIHAELIGL